MKTKPEMPKHLFVENPYSGRMVNVLPLFQALHQMDDIQESPATGAKLMKQTNRLINLRTRNSEIDQDEVTHLAEAIYTLEDMFEMMTELKER